MQKGRISEKVAHETATNLKMAIFQTTLQGEIVKPTDEKKPWDGICCENCWTAQEKTCTCKCHGAFHGLGNVNKRSVRRELI